MSLLSRRKPLEGLKRKERDEETLSKRNKPTKPKRFQISRTTLDYPVLGGKRSHSNRFGGSGSISLLPSTSSRTVSSSDSHSSPFFSSSSSASSSISSTSNIFSLDQSKAAEEALASSKLTTLSSGPLEAMPPVGLRQLKRLRKHERSLTKGSAWFNMAKAEITKEKKNDLEVLKLRSAMEGVLHYKRNNITHTPKYFHVGTVVETSADFFSSRIPKKQRKKTLAQEFAADFGV